MNNKITKFPVGLKLLRFILVSMLLCVTNGAIAGNQATAVVAGVINGKITRVEVQNGGAWYCCEPSARHRYGGGYGASVRAVVENGSVVAVNVVDGGNGYTDVGTIFIDPPGVPNPCLKIISAVYYGPLSIKIDGTPGTRVLIERAANLSGPWESITNVPLPSVGAVIIDPRPLSETYFYRASKSPDVEPVGFRLIPKGRFTMGSSGEDPQGLPPFISDEVQHTVEFLFDFWMCDHETTQQEWKDVTGRDLGAQLAKGPDLPVHVNWQDAFNYCKTLTLRERAAGLITPGQAYRLPTESEWEYAARAGSVGRRHGDLDQIAWWRGNSGGTIHSVKGKVPNAWGLYDMIGNVNEWCLNYYGAYPQGVVTEPLGPFTGTERVCRGGDINCYEFHSRSAERVPVPINWIGFRVILTTGSQMPY